MLFLNGQRLVYVLVGYELLRTRADVTGFTYYRANSSNACGGLTNLYHYSVNQGTYGSTLTTNMFTIGNSMSGLPTTTVSQRPGSSNYQFYGSPKNFFNGQDLGFWVVVEQTEVGNDGNTTITGDLNFTGDIYKDGVLSNLVVTYPQSRYHLLDPGQGDIWFDTDAGNSYIYYNDGTPQWIEMSPVRSRSVANTVNTLALQDLYVLPPSWVTVR